MVSDTRIFKKKPLQLRFVKEVSKPEPSEADDPTQIEVSNVPETVNEEVLKTYFEGAKSGSRANAVAECRKIGPGVFHVTFHDPKGMLLHACTKLEMFFYSCSNGYNCV